MALNFASSGPGSTGVNGSTQGNYNIGGNLPFGNTGQGIDAGINALGQGYGINLSGLAAGYNNAYNAALGMNQQNYNNILQGYQQTMQNQLANQKNIEQGYGGLYGQIANTLGQGGTPWGIAAPAAQAIADVNAQQQGAAQQNLVSSGLGGSTVLPNVEAGIGLQAQKAYGALGSNLAQTYAGYQSQLGLADLAYQNLANQQNTALADQQLNWMNSVQAPYPNAAAYAGIGQQAGAAQQAQQNFGLAAQQAAAQNQLQAAALQQQGQLGALGIAAQQQGNLLNNATAQQGNLLNALRNPGVGTNPYAALGSGMPSGGQQYGQGNPFAGMGGVPTGSGNVMAPAGQGGGNFPNGNNLGNAILNQPALNAAQQVGAGAAGPLAGAANVAANANPPGAGNPFANGVQLNQQDAQNFQQQALGGQMAQDAADMEAIFGVPQDLAMQLLMQGMTPEQIIQAVGGM